MSRAGLERCRWVPAVSSGLQSCGLLRGGCGDSLAGAFESGAGATAGARGVSPAPTGVAVATGARLPAATRPVAVGA